MILEIKLFNLLRLNRSSWPGGIIPISGLGKHIQRDDALCSRASGT